MVEFIIIGMNRYRRLQRLMDKTEYAFWMSVAGSLCWVVCFWWMHRISSKQNTFLDQLRQQGKRIEKLSKIEHDLIKEVHPQVAEIKEGIDAMVSVAKENAGRDLVVTRNEETSPPRGPKFLG